MTSSDHAQCHVTGTEKCILTKWLKPFFHIICTITIQKPFWRTLSMHAFWLMMKNKEMRIKNLLLWPLFFAYCFVFHFAAKPMLEFRENMMFFWIVLKSSNYNSLSRRKVLFPRHRKWYDDRIFSGLVPKHCWPGCQGNLHSLFGVSTQ